MEIVALPLVLPGNLDLEAINRQLHMGAVTLDWSQVQAATGAQLRVLLAGLDLVEHSDILGLASVPDALAEAMSLVFSRGQVLPEYHELSVPGDGQEAVNHEAKQIAEWAREQAVPAQAQTGTAGVPAVLKPLSPAQLRDELERLVLLELLGPAGGPEEELDETSVRDRYLVGTLAPRDQQIIPEELEELAIAEASSGEDGLSDETTLQSATLYPSSIGLSFCVTGSAASFRGTAGFGDLCGAPAQKVSTRQGVPLIVL